MAKQTPDRDSLGDSRRSLSRAAPAPGEAGDSGLRSGALRSDTSGRAAGGISSGWDCRLFTWASRWRPFTRATVDGGRLWRMSHERSGAIGLWGRLSRCRPAPGSRRTEVNPYGQVFTTLFALVRVP